MRKNIASQYVSAQLLSATDGSEVTTGTVTVKVTKDGDIQNTGLGSVVHEGSGVWGYTPTQAETNGNHIVFTFQHSDAMTTSIQVYTISFDPHNIASLGLTNLDTTVSSRSTFDETSDAVANVTLVDTVTTNTDMRGTDNALLASSYVVPDNASIAAILVDTNDLQTNQGDWLTATGFSTSAEVSALDTKVDDLPTVSEFTARTLPTASYFDASTDSVTLNTAQPSITFQPMTITASGTQDNLTLSGSGTGDGLVFSRSGTADLFDSNWVSALESVVWDASLPSYSASGTTGESLGDVFTVGDYTAPDNASIALILGDTNELQSNQGDWSTATGFATTAELNARTLVASEYFNSNTDSVNVGSVLGTNLVETSSGNVADNLSTFFDNEDTATSKVVDDVGTAVSGGGEFTTTEKNQLRYRLGLDGTAVEPTANPDLSQKSDISGLNDFNPSTDVVANVTLVDTTTTNTDMRGTNNAVLASSYTEAPTVSSIVDGVWGELQSGHTTIGTFGYYLDSRVSASGGGGGGSGATPAEIWAYSDRELTSGDNIVLAKGTGITGFNDIEATDIVTGGAIDTTNGSVDNVFLVNTTATNTDMRGTDSALLSSVYEAPDNISIASILEDTNDLQSNQGDWLTATGFNTVAPDNTSIASILTNTSTTIPNQISGLNDLSAAEVWTEQLVESYAADGVAPTATEALMLTQQFLTEFDITGTSYNVKRLDGTNSAATLTLNDSEEPTSITRS